MKIGLCGSHRSGKTTLASHLASKLSIPFSVTEVSKIFAEHNLVPSMTMSFSTRLWIQDIILTETRKVWLTSDNSFITDRTPIDMLAYTLADITSETKIDYDLLEAYMTRCFSITNEVFTNLFIIQPGIPLEYVPGKASLNKPYIELVNTIIMGLMHDSKLQVPFNVLNKKVLALQDRIQYVYNTLNY